MFSAPMNRRTTATEASKRQKRVPRRLLPHRSIVADQTSARSYPDNGMPDPFPELSGYCMCGHPRVSVIISQAYAFYSCRASLLINSTILSLAETKPCILKFKQAQYSHNNLCTHCTMQYLCTHCTMHLHCV